MTLLSSRPEGEGARRAQDRGLLNLEGVQCVAPGAHAATNGNPALRSAPCGSSGVCAFPELCFAGTALNVPALLIPRPGRRQIG